ncbi:MAG TPA: sulfur carrier protein ThiS [Terriglobales bacterium]|jgi:thiamine biosynthesis protein ThiS
MVLIINGEERTFTAATLAELIEQLGMREDRLAVELNRNIIPRTQWIHTALSQGDRLEIVQFVGGGNAR